MRGTPAGYRLYQDVVSRLAPVRADSFGLTFRCPFEDRHRSGDRVPSGRAWVGARGLLARCYGCGAPWREFVEWVGLPVGFWFADRSGKWSRDHGRRTMTTPSRIAAVYEYRDLEGAVLYQKVRWEPKRFSLRRPLPPDRRAAVGVPGNAEAWAWGLTAGVYRRKEGSQGWHFGPDYECQDGEPGPGQTQAAVVLESCTRVLYRLPELAGADPRQPVFFVEGEKDVDALVAIGFVATCSPCGSTGWESHWADCLEGRRVVVVPDNDTPGLHHAHTVTAACLAAGCESVRLLVPQEVLYDPPAGGDVTDWLKLRHPGRSSEDLRAAVVGLCKSYPEYARRVPPVVARPPETFPEPAGG